MKPVMGWLHVAIKLLLAAAGAYGGIRVFFFCGPALPESLAAHLMNDGVPFMGGLLPWIAFVWLASASAGALLSLVVWRLAVEAVFRRFGRRLVER